MNVCRVLIVLVFAVFSTVPACAADNISAQQQIRAGHGLIGTYYNGDDFDEPEKGMIDILTTIDYDWGGDRGGGWSARWTGFIEWPVTGEVTLVAEARDGLRLTVGNTIVIDGLTEGGPRSGKVNMVKGKKEPIKLELVSTKRKALLRLYWQWAGRQKQLIPASALSHSTDNLPEKFLVFDYDNRPSDQDDDDWVYPTQAFAVGDIDLSGAKIVALNPGSKIQANAADMLRDEIEKRTRIGLEVVTSMPAKEVPAIVLGVGKEVTEKYPLPEGLELPNKADGYTLWIETDKRDARTVCLAGVDKRGALFAAGRLLRILKMSRDMVGVDEGIKIAAAPRYSLRGHQLGYRPKTNSYDGWTIEMWEQYYRDMIVFGMNAIELIPPASDDAENSPHFPKPKLEMMIDMSQLAADYGLDVWIWFTALDEIDGVKVDYGDTKTVEASLVEWAEVFRKLPKIDDVFVPGGDPGNTHPAILLPFMEKQKKVLNKYHPKARIWVSPQNFDRKGRNRDGWYKAFIDILQKDSPNWLDGVVFGPTVPVSLPDLRQDVPAKFTIRRYPDITHCRSCPYSVQDWDRAFNDTLGREPINPRPVAYAQIFRDLQQYAIGFISYSEGCNDDFNKVLWSCLGWDPDMKVEDIVKEFSRYFISGRYEDKFARGLFGLERNWVGPLRDNDGVYETLELFQEMERGATPQDKLNWRFQQALYRAYYDAYIRHRLIYETKLEDRAMDVLKNAKQLGSLAAIDRAEGILDKATTQKAATDLRQRVFELAEALFQSIRMQHSVQRYQSQRYANLDDIDEPLNNSESMKKSFSKIRREDSEQERLVMIREIKGSEPFWHKSSGADWPNWKPVFDEYQRSRSAIWKSSFAD